MRPHADFEHLRDLLHSPIAVDETIAPGDEMFAANREHYLQVGQSALQCIRLALLAADKPASQVQRILDLPCGHGRVLRTLRAAFPEASITAGDVLREAVDYCAKAFGAEPFYSSPDLGELTLDASFDLIWCGSLLTHLDSDRWSLLLDLFDRLLEPGGVLLFTCHGRSVFDRIQKGWDYGLDRDRLRLLVQQHKEKGFGYVDYPGQQGYGISVSARPWVLSQLDQHPRLRLLSFHERGWDDHQDVVVCVREAWEAPPGPAEAEHARTDFGI